MRRLRFWFISIDWEENSIDEMKNQRSLKSVLERGQKRGKRGGMLLFYPRSASGFKIVHDAGIQ
jgi:hypothetical protein